MHNALSDEKLYIEVRIFLSHLLQLSPGISRKQAFHHVQFLIQEKVRSMILSYLTSNKWFAAKVNTLKLPVIYPTKFRIYLSSYTNHRHSILLCRILATGMNIYLLCKVGV